MAVIARKISSEFFTWNKDTKCFITELSDLPDERTVFSQVYDDACDAGFTLVSAKTGRELVFYLSGEDRDGEDVAGWRYELTPESLRKFPEAKGVTALVIND